MTIKNKKIVTTGVIIITVILISIIYLRIKLVHHWNTDPEAICNRAGGFWDIVDNTTCSDLCRARSEHDCYDRRGYMGCWCGLDKCWDGRKCINKSSKVK
jgi:hypothetical protein